MSRPRIYHLTPFRAAAWLARRTPRPLRHVVGSAIARALYRRRPHTRRALESNLARVSGRSGAALRSLCRQNVANFGRMLADYFHLTGASPETIRRHLGHRDGMAHLSNALARGRGAIVITAHLGNWELGALVLALDGLPMQIVTLPEPSAALTDWRRSYRRRLGIRTITVGEDRFAFVDMINALRRNEIVAMLVDRPYAGSGTRAPFFGAHAPFSTGPALLFQHTGAAVIPAFVLQQPDRSYQSLILEEVAMRADLPPDTAREANTAAVAARIESVVREHPDQWYNFIDIWTDPTP